MTSNSEAVEWLGRTIVTEGTVVIGFLIALITLGTLPLTSLRIFPAFGDANLPAGTSASALRLR